MRFFRWLFRKKEHIEKSVIEHSSKGDFTFNPKSKKISRMKSGGHGQENIDFLEKIGFQYNIVKEYDNGVRIGNVVLHKDVKKRTGTNQFWFPKEWGRKDIFEAGNYVARHEEKASDGIQVDTMYKGVNVGIIRTNGKVSTIYPTKMQKERGKNGYKNNRKKSK